MRFASYEFIGVDSLQKWALFGSHLEFACQRELNRHKVGVMPTSGGG